MTQSSERIKREAKALEKMLRSQETEQTASDSSTEVRAILELERWRMGFPCDTRISSAIEKRSAQG